ncbi:DUF6069 family protein [Terrabacter sp. NPDC080008]|uniref:DUF6069 family protein n=1 Tax=Terrabacter sp. NPDC080008 TaxID=3155176 RepID=UPI00344B0989
MTGSDVPGPPPKTRILVDAGRLWGGGAATGCVAALLAVVGVLICQDVLKVRLTRPALLVHVSDSLAVNYALTAFLLAIAATGMAHLLILATPKPRTFFAWLVGLATVCGVAAPFALEAPVSSQVATAAINLALGVCTGSLISAVMTRTTAVSRGPRGAGPAPLGTEQLP